MQRDMLRIVTKRLFHQPVILKLIQINQISYSTSSVKPLLNYTQGQHNKKNDAIREYFYYIDHNGMLFLDDSKMKNFTSCFKEKKFLQFFFKRIKPTTEDEQLIQKYFPFTSHCGRERNYIRTDDNATPFVFSSLVNEKTTPTLEYNGSGLSHPFNPSSLYEGSNGRLYHEFNKHDVGFALVKSSLADWMIADQRFVYDDGGLGGEIGSDNKTSHAVAFVSWETNEEIKLNYSLRDMVESALNAAPRHE